MGRFLNYLFGFLRWKAYCEPEQCSAGCPDKRCNRRRTRFYDALFCRAARFRKHRIKAARVNHRAFKSRSSLSTEAVDLALGVVVTVVERFSGRPGKSDESISSRLLQSAAFLHGIAMCEQAILEAMYSQAGALVRQEMECIAAMEESKLGTRKEKRTPNVNNAPPELRTAYGQLSMMTHTSSTAMLESLLARASAPAGYVSVVPQYNHEAARMLLGLHAAILIEFAVQLHILYLDAYGEGLTPLEQDSLQLSTYLLQENGFLPKPPPDEVLFVPADAAMMRAAEEEARKTLPHFLNILKERKSPNQRFSVKVRFEEGGLSEYMWLTDLALEGNRIHGAVANFPNRIKRPRFKQRVTITDDQITDWIIVEGGEIQGAFTAKVLTTTDDTST
jgi:uncharacterized protein YegJ (DUF2314 family)